MKKNLKYPLIVGGIAVGVLVLIILISVMSSSDTPASNRGTQTTTEPLSTLDPELYPADAAGCSVECTTDSDCVVDNCLGCFNKENLRNDECVKDCPKPKKASCRCLQGKCITL